VSGHSTVCNQYDGWYDLTRRTRAVLTSVAPAELEAVLLTHPDVADVAVIGIWMEDQATELPRAYVVPRNRDLLHSAKEREAFCKQVEEWMKDKVAQHKRIRGGCVLIEAVPKS
jgi:acyl-coenzyme A synthetase/AMP-(fatty) acid ligase